MLGAYLPILLLIVFAILFGIGSLLLSSLIGPKKPTPLKLSPYECGCEPVGSARERFSVKFYLIAMLFILFDIEAVFLYPWSILFKRMVFLGLSRWEFLSPFCWWVMSTYGKKERWNGSR